MSWQRYESDNAVRPPVVGVWLPFSGSDSVFCYDSSMEIERKIDVAALDAPHRRAVEEFIGPQLASNQQVVISVTEPVAPQDSASGPVQTLEGWTDVYEGLSDLEIEAIDQVAKTRANLSRNLP